MADPQPESAGSRIDLASIADFDLGGLLVSPAHRTARSGSDSRELEPRVAQVLVALALARPAVVSRDRLIEQCWDGRIVGDDAINRCIVALRQLGRSFVPEPFTIETVPRVGYCLVERPVVEVPVPNRRPRIWAAVSIAVALVLVVLGGALALGWSPLGRADPPPASIAVMPFRNLSGGEPYFAEGIGEEIIGQLAREPQFRVAGSNSSSEWGKNPDSREVGRRLKVEFVLEGSVRRQGEQVRVNAALIRASDGNRIWSDSYDGKLDDIFAIQQRIGGAIAGELRRKLVDVPATAGPMVTNGEAYNLYLIARGLLKAQQRSGAPTAANLLRDAINLDPGYAPAWASLAEAEYLAGWTKQSADPVEGTIGGISQAQVHARHALRLAPDLAEGHRILASLLGFGSPDAQAHFRRAAELDPNSAEIMVGLGRARGAAGEFDGELAAYRRAGELDPLWFRSVGSLGITLAEMGNRAEAEAVAGRGFTKDKINQHILLGRIAWVFGDYSEAARRWSIVAQANSPRWSGTAQGSLDEMMFTLGLGPGPPRRLNPSRGDQIRRFRVWMDAPPAPAVWQARNRDAIAADVYRDANHVAAKLMLKAGRVDELAAAYDGPVGLLSLRAQQPLRVDQLHETPAVVLALRAAGRASEADRLLREADARLRSVYGRGRAPFWFDADAAAIWAVQGRKDKALSALERAMGRGWTHAATTDLRDLADEPAFRSLRGQPRFERIRARLDAHHARERAETRGLRQIAKRSGVE